MKSTAIPIADQQRSRPGRLLRLATVLLWLSLGWIFAVGSGQAGPLPDGPPLPIRSLKDFEAQAQSAPEVLAAAAELDERLADLDQVQAESGLRAFAGSRVGQYREQVTEDRIRDYSRISLFAGLRYPLLGSKSQVERDLLKANSSVLEKRRSRDQALRSSQLAMRLHYINYWAVQEKSLLAERFLENDSQMSGVLQQRTHAGLLLDADRREFMAAFAMARRDLERFEIVRQRALSMLALLTGSPVKPFQAVFPDLPAPATDPGRLQAVIGQSHPLILDLEDKVDACRGLLELSENAYPKGYVALSSSVSSDLNDAPPGYGVALEFNLDFPFRLKQAGAAKRASARAALEKARRELQIAKGRLLSDAREDLQQYLAGETEIGFALQRLASAREQIRENLLRSVYLAGDVIEKLQKSRVAYYQATLAYIDVQARRLQSQARILNYAPNIAAADSTLSGKRERGPAELAEIDDFDAFKMPAAPPRVPSGGREASAGGCPDCGQGGLPYLSMYVWDSERLLRKYAEQSDMLEGLTRSGIRRLLVSFTARQIDSLDHAARRRQVIDFLHAAGLHGIRIELLLGEPLWILEQFRPHLPALIRRLADIPFQGIHLDLEPNQLISDGYKETDLQAQLLKTLQAVKAATDLPLGLSIHYRYMTPSAAGICLGCAFKDLGVDEVTLMIYVSDPGRVAQIAGPIMARFPELTFSIAQSVEPILLPEESYYAQSRSRFLEQMRALDTALEFNNFQSVQIQSWEDYCEMRP